MNSCLSLAFCLVVHQPHDGENKHLSPALHPVSVFQTDTDSHIHKAIACKYLSSIICTVVEAWHHGCFCLGYFFSSTHFHLVRRMARKVWRQCVLIYGHDRYSHAGKCICLLSHTGLFLATGNRYFFLHQRHSFPFDS